MQEMQSYIESQSYWESEKAYTISFKTRETQAYIQSVIISRLYSNMRTGRYQFISKYNIFHSETESVEPRPSKFRSDSFNQDSICSNRNNSIELYKTVLESTKSKWLRKN